MADDEPHHSSCSAATATSSGGSSSSPSPPPLPLAAVVSPLPPPLPSTSIATAIPLSQQQQHHQQLLQQYQHQLQQQQRLFSFHLSSAAVASASPPTPTPTALPLKHTSPVPAFTPGGAAPSDRHSRDDCWSEGATFTLIQAWGGRYLELNRGNLKQKHWKDVADCVNRRADGSKPPKTDIQCKNRLDTLKKKYKLEKSKTVSGGSRKWTFFDRLDELIGPSKKPKKPMPVKPRPALPLLPPPVITLPAKRHFEDADQPPPQPLALPPPNYSPSSAANHLTLNHAPRASNPISVTPNHVGSAPNHAICAPSHAGIITNYISSGPNLVVSAPNQFGSNPAHVASAVDAVSKSKDSPHTADSCPNGETAQPKRSKRKHAFTDPLQELAQAITKFGEVYERTEITRQQTLAEIEKQRMIFTKDLELQRLQFFTQTQVELAKLRQRFKHDQNGVRADWGSLRMAFIQRFGARETFEKRWEKLCELSGIRARLISLLREVRSNFFRSTHGFRRRTVEPSTSGNAGGNHNEDFGNEYGPPLPTQEELRKMEHRRLVGEATNLMLNFDKDPKLAKYMSETAFQDVQAQWKATPTSPPKPDSKKQYSEKELEEEIDARLAQILGAQKQGNKHDRKQKKSTDFPGYLGSQSTFDKAKKHKKRAAVPSSSSSSDSSSESSEEERRSKKRSKRHRHGKGKRKTRKSKSRRVDDSSTEDSSTDSLDSEDGHFYANKKNFYKANQRNRGRLQCFQEGVETKTYGDVCSQRVHLLMIKCN
ncbi:hypothetical protein L7F22_000777 [Adiantum nelumboides]|nr:hypothetical protein [Adiantum nelumboides]